MSITFEMADRMFRAEKRLLLPAKWQSVPNNRSELLRKLEARLLVDRSIPRGVFFRVIVYPGSPDTATFQLECEQPAQRTRVVLYRLDLAPRQPHTNKLYGPLGGLYIPAFVTHEHLFYDSVTADGRLRSRSDEQARLIDQPPQDFPSALELVCSRINILNGSEISVPGDQRLLV